MAENQGDGGGLLCIKHTGVGFVYIKVDLVITKMPNHSHITPVLQNVTSHWLPGQERIKYNRLLITFQASAGLAPLNIRDRNFKLAVPTLWNCMPHHLRDSDKIESYKSSLKNWLKAAFE